VRDRLGQRGARLPTEVAAPCDGRAQSEEDRFVVEGSEPMAGDEGDEQMDRIRA
jgi:hypothetical protein